MPEFLADPTLILFGKLTLAALLGIMIGTERAAAGKQAGSRTFSLVSVGACLFVIISNYVTGQFINLADIQPTYMAAAIITGVGFIGAGLIVIHGEAPRGITTAAGLWVSAAVGSAIGFGMYAVGIFTTILTILIFTAVWFLETSFKHWVSEVRNGNGHSN